MPFEVVDAWDRTIRLDLQNRAGADRTWSQAEMLVRNTGSGFRHGNLVSSFHEVLHRRLFGKPFHYNAEADDPDFIEQAEDFTVVAQSLARICDLKTHLFNMTADASWATTGWAEVGHPMDPWSNDIMRSVHSPNVDQKDMLPEGASQDEFEPVDPAEAQLLGLTPDNVLPFDPFQGPPPEYDSEPANPVPVFEAHFGYPWVAKVDPRLIIIPYGAKTNEDLDYRARVRFVTRAELKKLRNIDFGRSSGMLHGDMRTLFEVVEKKDPAMYPEMMALVEVYITRDRNNPQFNNWLLSYVYGEPKLVVFNHRNPYGGMIPLVPLRTNPIRGFHDTPLAREIADFADMFDMSVQGLMRDMRRSIAHKWLTSNAAGLKPEDAQHLMDDRFEGEIKVQDVNSVARLKETEIDHNRLMIMNYIKSLAQSTSGGNDMDRGQPISSISATQTRALLSSTGINIDSIRDGISKTAVELIMKITHLAGIYNQQGKGRKYSTGAKVVSMDRGTHDMTSSFLYCVEIVDAEETSIEERMAWSQFLGILMKDQAGFISSYFDRETLAKRTVKKWGETPMTLASRAAGREGQGRVPMDPQLQAAQSGNAGGPPGQPQQLGLQDMVEGQHPERMTGSRGVDPGGVNALSGMMKTGMRST